MSEPSATDQLLPALLAAQRAFRPVLKEKTAEVRTRQGAYKYSYADLAGVIDACVDALHEHGLLVQQPVKTEIRVETVHELQRGEWIEVRKESAYVSVATHLTHADSCQFQVFEGLTISAGSAGPQQIGSAITYARRYSLICALGVAPEDDDGSSAQQAYDRQHGDAAQKPKLQSQQSRSQSPEAARVPKYMEQANNQQQQPEAAAKETTATDRVQEALRKAGCQKAGDARLVLNWATNNAFGELDPLQEIKKPEQADAILERLKALHKEGKRADNWLQLAHDWKQAVDSAAEWDNQPQAEPAPAAG